jgi:hypothetical protein
MPVNQVSETIIGCVNHPCPNGPTSRAASVQWIDIGNLFDRGIDGPGE